uniref:Uncharacterized protein n=1 Tax=Syphacia muris TaxID=451379 RepID=A0A0N5AIV9_9BILA
MASVIRPEAELTCYDNIEACRKDCVNWECIHMDNCNGSDGMKFVCLPVNLQYVGWLIFGIFIIVATCCSSLVICYICQALSRQARHTNSKVVFYKFSPNQSRSLPQRLNQLSYDPDESRCYINPIPRNYY